MAATMHPHVLVRRTKPGTITQVISRPVIHVVVYAPTPERREWVEQELTVDATIQLAHGVDELVSTLIEDAHPRPQLLVVDLDRLSAGELFHLHKIREHGWCGGLIALGQVPPSLRASLQVTRVLGAPFLEHALADELVRSRCATEEKTMPLPTFPEAPSRGGYSVGRLQLAEITNATSVRSR